MGKEKILTAFPLMTSIFIGSLELFGDAIPSLPPLAESLSHGGSCQTCRFDSVILRKWKDPEISNKQPGGVACCWSEDDTLSGKI